ncbi:MAG: type I methionyl aminopeptidase [Candidatus Tagabacteria bacterium RIFCSPLOWO2_01_FULL_39_11]|uniref:Methionine aminopeptidase n=1 Tax=Candidatus Tagabacteria bacterium RIFCSPLOWO2_01_FULL_39_11 TaxID=1802295 RepID=A0A1G2LNB2_9BACT|nr:MAG: type I methionyl aminopeptidase [Candidatus Tagabacteria bacterium RIFCSPLOWO2_01_FULL_39_11]
MITIKTEKEIEILKEAGHVLASILYAVLKEVKPGVSALNLDKYAEELIYKAGGRPSFKGFKTKDNKISFPSSLCVSLNDEVVHGIPYENKILKSGDIVSLDLGMEYKGLFVDMARTIIAGQTDEICKNLLEVCRRALEAAIFEAHDGNFVGDISESIQKYVKSHGFNVVRKLVGHGVGYGVHEEPEIPNFGRRGGSPKLKKGMILAIEPMITERGFDVFLDCNGWTWKTKDGSRAAHFEDTVLVGGEKGEALTDFV